MSRRARIAVDGEQLEDAWQEQILQTAELFGWYAHHTYDSRRSVGDGFPDLVLARPCEPVLYAELKRHDGTLSRLQRHWLALLCGTMGATVYMWRAPKLSEGNARWREISEILRHGPNSLARAEQTTLWIPQPGDLMSKQEMAEWRLSQKQKRDQRDWRRKGLAPRA